MEGHELITVLSIAGRLKDATRHCYTAGGRRESVAEHSWRISLMAMFIRDEFPDADMDKVIRMCLIHDLGEAFTGDIPTFDKTRKDEKMEEELLTNWVNGFSEPLRSEMLSLYAEMEERKTTEAQIFKALDSLEALIQHNESDLSTWTEEERAFNLTYADDKTAFSPYLKALREIVREDTIRKITM